MSPIGRIFVVISLALAAMLLGSASAFLGSNDSYKNQFQAKEVELAELKRLNADTLEKLKADIAQAERQMREANEARQEIEADKERLLADVAGLKDEKAQLGTSVAGLETQLGNLNTIIADVTTKADNSASAQVQAVEAREAALNAQQQAEAAAAEATDRANGLADQIVELETRLASVTDDLMAEQTLVAVALSKGGWSREELGSAPKPIDGAVQSVTRVDNATLVHVNRGSSDGVELGYVFDVFSVGEREYKGRARVVLVHGSTCTAVMTTQKAGTTVIQGDSASTRLGS